MKWRLFFLVLLISYALLIIPFANLQKERPVAVKLGYIPHPQILKVVSGEHRPTVAGMIVLRVLFYFGTVLQNLQENIIVRPEFYNMFKTLQGAAHLDPYNMDVYYFAQAEFTWELGRIEEVNYLLEIGMENRKWDYWLPYYLGFNYAYFLKDYKKAAIYMRKAAELSGSPFFTKLAARYFYESEQSSFGLAFLESMIKNAKSESIKITYILRRDALLAVIQINDAVREYKNSFGREPPKLSDLTKSGILSRIPIDPYGGDFYFDEQRKVRTTSKFSNPDL